MITNATRYICAYYTTASNTKSLRVAKKVTHFQTHANYSPRAARVKTMVRVYKNRMQLYQTVSSLCSVCLEIQWTSFKMLY